MIVITRLTAGCKHPNDTFPHEYEMLPRENEAVYSVEKNVFYLDKIIYEPHAGKMMPIVVLTEKVDATILCG
jgi:hypothetical protein